MTVRHNMLTFNVCTETDRHCV